jgi:uncharacterized membrane protein
MGNKSGVSRPNSAHGRDRSAALAGAVLLTLAVPIALDQEYLRYNVWVLPVLGLVAALLYVYFIATSPWALSITKRFLRRSVFGCVIVIGILSTIVLSFLVYGELWALEKSREHVAEVKAQETDHAAQEAKLPHLGGQIDGIAAAPFGPKKEDSVITIMATISNTGTPTVVNSFSVAVKLKDGKVIQAGGLLPAPDVPTVLYGDHGDKQMEFRPSEYLPTKTREQPIVTNGAASGFYQAVVEGVKRDTIMQSGVIVSLSFKDVLGNVSELLRVNTGKPMKWIEPSAAPAAPPPSRTAPGGTPQPKQESSENLLLPAGLPSPASGCPVPSGSFAVYLASSVYIATGQQSIIADIREAPEVELLGVSMEGNGLSIDARIFDDRQNLVAKIEHGRFIQTPFAAYQKRPDRSTLIVYDHRDREVLNVTLLNKSAVLVKRANLYTSDGERSVLIDGDVLLPGKGTAGGNISHNCYMGIRNIITFSR